MFHYSLNYLLAYILLPILCYTYECGSINERNLRSREFISKIELLTIAIIKSFITMKFLNAIYEPVMDSDKPDKYYLKIGKYYVQAVCSLWSLRFAKLASARFSVFEKLTPQAGF